MTSAEYKALTTARKPAGKGKPPPKASESPVPAPKPANRRDAETLARHQAAPTVKALFQVATFAGYDGARLVAVGLDEQQVAALRTAAEAAGVSERQ